MQSSLPTPSLPFCLSLLCLAPACTFFSDLSRPASKLAVGEEGLGWLCQGLDLDTQASQISRVHMGLAEGGREQKHEDEGEGEVGLRGEHQ